MDTKTLEINKKTGFSTVSPMVIIYRNGKPFYVFAKKTPVLNFNLPPGVYQIVLGDIFKMDSPVNYQLIDLPRPNRVTRFPRKIDIYWCENPNKCSVSVSARRMKIYFDEKFREEPDYVIMWIIGHEFSHYMYRGQGQKSEQNCDHLGANLMLIEGFNPAQIDAAINQAISNGYHAKKRKKLLYENLITVSKNGSSTKQYRKYSYLRNWGF